MILVDTSVWIDHFHHSDPVLVSLLHEDEIGSHPLVAEELAMGSLRSRDDVLKHLAHLRQFPVLSHDELLALVAAHALWSPAPACGHATSDCSALPKSAESPSPKEPPAEALKRAGSPNT